MITAPVRQFVYDHLPASLLFVLGRINRLRYRGSRYACPICESTLSTFLPLPREFDTTLEIENQTYTVSAFETLQADHYLCPVCRCADRERMIALFLLQIPVSEQRHRSLLHFAPEKALSSFLRSRFDFSYQTADLHRTDVDLNADITRLDPFGSESIDCFICSHVLEHVPDDAKALSELYRILKPGGWGIILSPVIPALRTTYEDSSYTTESDRLRHFGQKDHVRVYGKADFIERMQWAGFNVTELGSDKFGPAALVRHGISASGCLYLVRKSPTTHRGPL